MKEEDSNISTVLHELTEVIRRLREKVATQHTEIRNLTRNAQKLNNELRKRDKTIERLMERLAKYGSPGKNSGNSSTPPSKERMRDEVVRRTRSLRKPTGRKPGGQEDCDRRRGL